jgi:hypothetical protein
MANIVTSKRVPGTTPLSMSNGLTDVFFDVLTLAGRDRATTTWEQQFLYWLVLHDQSRSGRGCVGFDVEQMGWTRDDFEAQKRFVLAIIDAARAKSGWRELCFTPHDDILTTLDQFRAMVEAFPIEATGAETDREWESPTHGMCEKHRVYRHEVGCIICNDDDWV